MIGIYKITNPNERVYIGQSRDIETRWKYHKWTVDRDLDSNLLRSFRKYGTDNHLFEIVEECTIEELNSRERYWQDYFNVLEGGLNQVLQSAMDKPRIISEETKVKTSKSLSNWHREIGHSLETRKKMSESHKGVRRGPSTKEHIDSISIGVKEWWSNGGLSKDSRHKISDTLRNKPTYVCDKCGYTYKEAKRKSHENSTMCEKRSKIKYCRVRGRK